MLIRTGTTRGINRGSQFFFMFPAPRANSIDVQTDDSTGVKRNAKRAWEQNQWNEIFVPTEAGERTWETYQKAVTEEKPGTVTITQKEMNAKVNWKNRSNNPPTVPAEPIRSFILFAGGPAPSNCGGTPTGWTAGWTAVWLASICGFLLQAFVVIAALSSRLRSPCSSSSSSSSSSVARVMTGFMKPSTPV